MVALCEVEVGQAVDEDRPCVPIRRAVCEDHIRLVGGVVARLSDRQVGAGDKPLIRELDVVVFKDEDGTPTVAEAGSAGKCPAFALQVFSGGLSVYAHYFSYQVACGGRQRCG